MPMAESDECWKPIPDFPEYEVSTNGRILNRRLGHVLTGTVTRRGHRQVNVRGSRRRMSVAVHRLVATTFLGPPPSGHVVRHLNNNKLDNRPVNLMWAPRTA